MTAVSISPQWPGPTRIHFADSRPVTSGWPKPLDRMVRFAGETVPVSERHVKVPYGKLTGSNFYPESMPYQTHRIRVSPLHEISVTEYGNPKGQPVVYLHGGPGGGSSSFNTHCFNPDFYRIIQFDQRGCGESTPSGELRENTTQNLIADMETIRKRLNIQQWVVAGHSWGSALSLAYAEAHPERVRGMVISGVFLGNRNAIQWLYEGGASQIFPDLWQRLTGILPPRQRAPHRIVSAFLEKMRSSDPQEKALAMRAWNGWESAILQAVPDVSKLDELKQEKPVEKSDAEMALLECFYAKNGYFLKPDQLLKNLGKISHIPVFIVQGRNDWVCPFKNAWDVHRQLSNSKLFEVEAAGHGGLHTLNGRRIALDAMQDHIGANKHQVA